MLRILRSSTAYLAVVHGFIGLAIGVVAARFHLDNGQCAVFFGHDVQLVMAFPPVSVADVVALLHQIVGRNVLADFTQYVVSCHRYVSFVFLQI